METVSQELHVRLFGSFKLLEGGLERPLPASSHARSLLAYLFLNPKKTHSRLALAALLSPDASETIARRLLNQTLWYIRGCVPGLVTCESNAISLSPTWRVVIDVAEFERRIQPYLSGKGRPQEARRDLTQAVGDYHGDLLEGFYDDWVVPERERLRELYFQALEHLVQAYKAAQEYQQALNVALRLVKGDPLRESAQREIIRLHHLLGNGSAAIKQYQEFRELLQHELGMDPEPETLELVREIVRRSYLHQPAYLPETSAPAGRSLLETNAPDQLPLVGRSAEKRMILRRLEAVFLQGGAIVLLEGEPGVGKTRLLQEIQRDLEWRGAQVITSKVSQVQSTQVDDLLVQALKAGLSPLRIEQIRSLAAPEQWGWLEETLTHLLSRPDHLAASDPTFTREGRRTFARGLSRLLGLWSQVAPLVIVLEDFHWAGEDTWETLVDLIEPLYVEKPAGVGIVISMRPEEARSQPWIQAAVARLSETGVLAHVELRPLDREASSELMRAFLGIQHPLAPIETRLFQETGGNPLFVLESLRLLYAQGCLYREVNGAWQIEPEAKPATAGSRTVPPMVEGTLARRLEQLPPPALEVLQTLAVLGDATGFASLRLVCGMDLPVLLACLNQLVQAHFLVETAEDYHFTHDLLQKVAYDSLPEEQCRNIHIRAGYALESRHPEQVEALAYHFEAGPVPDRAAAYHEKAGEAARQRNAYHQAAHHYQKAIDWAGRAELAPARLFDLLIRHESILDILGERDAQMEALKRIDQLIHQHRLGNAYRLKSQFRWAGLLYALGQYPRSETVARQALALAESERDPLVTGQAMLAIGSALHGAGHDDQAIPYLQAAIPHLQASGDQTAESKAWQTLTVIFSDTSQYGLAMEAIETSIALNRLLDNRAALSRDLIFMGRILFEQGAQSAQFERVEMFFQEALQISRSVGDQINIAVALDMLGVLAAERGFTGQAQELFEKALDICRFLKEEKLRISILIEEAGMMISCTGDFEQAGRRLREAERLARSHQLTRDLASCAGSWAEIDFYRGDLQAARTKLKKAVHQIQKHSCPGEEIWIWQLLVELELAAGRPAAALQCLEEAERLAQNIPLGSFQPDLTADRSAVLLANGRCEEALQVSSQAMRSLVPGWNSHVNVPYRHYQALAACGKKADAYQALSTAVQWVNNLIASLPPQQQQTSRDGVPIHREILMAWDALQPRQQSVLLPPQPGAGPAGQPVRVTWTVWLPEDNEIPGKVGRRRHQLQRLLAEAARQGASPAHSHLADALGVSRRTIAQDMAELRHPGE